MAFPFESQRITLLSRLAQPHFLTAIDPTPDPTLMRGIPVTDKNFASVTPKISDNSEDAQGNDFATDEFLHSWDSEREMELPITSEDIGYALLAAFGNVASSQPSAGPDPTVWQHDFTLQDPNVSRQLGARTLVEILGTAYNMLFPSMVCESFSVKGASTDRLLASQKFRGSGRRKTGSGLSIAQALAQIPVTSGRHYMLNSQASIRTANNNDLANGVFDYGGGLGLETWEFMLDNALLADDAYRPGCGRFMNITTPGVPQVETIIVVGTVGTSGTLILTVTANGMSNSPKAVTVTVASGDTPTVSAGKIRTALNADPDVSSFFVAGGTGANVNITARLGAANDATMNLALALGTATAVTPVPTSTHTTPGTAEISDPTSGMLRAELLFGRRKVTIGDFTVRAQNQSRELADLLSRRAIDWTLTITGPTISSTFKHQLIFKLPLTKYDVVQLNAGNAISQLKISPRAMFDTAQGFIIKATLFNTISSYTT